MKGKKREMPFQRAKEEYTLWYYVITPKYMFLQDRVIAT